MTAPDRIEEDPVLEEQQSFFIKDSPLKEAGIEKKPEEAKVEDKPVAKKQKKTKKKDVKKDAPKEELKESPLLIAEEKQPEVKKSEVAEAENDWNVVVDR